MASEPTALRGRAKLARRLPFVIDSGTVSV